MNSRIIAELLRSPPVHRKLFIKTWWCWENFQAK